VSPSLAPQRWAFVGKILPTLGTFNHRHSMSRASHKQSGRCRHRQRQETPTTTPCHPHGTERWAITTATPPCCQDARAVHLPGLPPRHPRTRARVVRSIVQRARWRG
jgi:hypothetical protein